MLLIVATASPLPCVYDDGDGVCCCYDLRCCLYHGHGCDGDVRQHCDQSTPEDYECDHDDGACLHYEEPPPLRRPELSRRKGVMCMEAHLDCDGRKERAFQGYRDKN